MALSHSPPTTAGIGPLGKRRFRPIRFAVWQAGALAIAGGLAWASTHSSGRYAPVLLLPAGLGLLLGLMLALGMQALETAHRPSLLAGSLLAATFLVAGQHYFPYVAWRAHEPSAAEALAAQVFPEVQERGQRRAVTFVQFLRDEAARGMTIGRFPLDSSGVWLLWAASAALTMLGTVILVFLTLQRPYCDRCGRWYQVIRFGGLDASTAGRVASLMGLSNIPHGAPRYRLWTCSGGCEPSGCELSWNVRTRRAWIDRETMAAATKLLDADAAPRPATGSASLPAGGPASAPKHGDDDSQRNRQ